MIVKIATWLSIIGFIVGLFVWLSGPTKRNQELIMQNQDSSLVLQVSVKNDLNRIKKTNEIIVNNNKRFEKNIKLDEYPIDFSQQYAINNDVHGFTKDILNNLQYMMYSNESEPIETIKFIDGKYINPIPEIDSLTEKEIEHQQSFYSIAINKIVFGHLNNDSTIDAIVQIVKNVYKDTEESLYAVLNINNQPLILASTIELGNEDAIEIKIEHGIVKLKIHGYGDEDANCCPTQYSLKIYKLIGHQFKFISRVIIDEFKIKWWEEDAINKPISKQIEFE